MAPVRRYIRITKYSVLECRIYLDNPALAQSWLLNPRDPVLPRVIESIRPKVLPKLREERERSKKKGSKKKKSIKDVIVQDDFEVSMFLTETSTRHSLLAKQKHFREKMPSVMRSNSTRLIGESNAEPVDVDVTAETAAPVLIEEDSDDDNGARLAQIPLAEPRTLRKRQRSSTAAWDHGESFGGDDATSAVEVDSDGGEPVQKRARGPSEPVDDGDDEDDKKKMAMDVTYDGFAIYGRVLCLVVKRRDGKAQTSRTNARGVKAAGQGQARMENWISSTQMPVGEEPVLRG